jgi:hypothetical protein
MASECAIKTFECLPIWLHPLAGCHHGNAVLFLDVPLLIRYHAEPFSHRKSYKDKKQPAEKQIHVRLRPLYFQIQILPVYCATRRSASLRLTVMYRHLGGCECEREPCFKPVPEHVDDNPGLTQEAADEIDGRPALDAEREYSRPD